jgi:hypothetical protein
LHDFFYVIILLWSFADATGTAYVAGAVGVLAVVF